MWPVNVKHKFKNLTLFMSVLVFLLIAIMHNVYLIQVKAERNEDTLTEKINIENIEDFNKLIDKENKGRTFLLKNDIDLLGSYWTPFDTYEMTGTFDGGGHAIKNVSVNLNKEYTGLFSKNGLNIRNLFIKNIDTNGGENSGGLAGLNKGKIDNVHIVGTVNAKNSSGGLIAENYGDIDNCSFEGKVNSRTAAGLVANNNGSAITNSFSIGEVKGQKIGGLVSSALKASEKTQKLANNFSFCEMNLIEYDDTIKRVGGFVAVREQGVIIENCFSGNDYPCIAYGDFNGVKELSADKQKDKNSFTGFDFDNYWNWSSEINGITQRTVAVSSNTIEMNGTDVIIKGDKKYYIKGETATLSIFANGKDNFGILNAYIDGSEIAFENGKYIIEVQNQINVQFTPQYLLLVELNKSTPYGTLKQAKQYYAPNEPIIFEVIPNERCEFNKLTATFNGSYVTFINLEGNKYEAKLQNEQKVYAENSILFIDATFTYNAPFNWFILLWIGIGIVVTGGTALLIIYRKKITKVINKKLLLTALMILLALIAISALIVWLLLLTDVIMAGSLQILLLILMPIIAAACVVGIWSINTLNNLKKGRGKK